MNFANPHGHAGPFFKNWRMRDGTQVVIRPICPDDEASMVRFHKTLSEDSVHHRYFGQLDIDQRTRHERLVRICHNDYETEFAFVAEHKKANGRHEILGVGRLSRAPGSDEAEFAILVSDLWQGRGLGTELLRHLVRIGRVENLKRIVAHILPDNFEMQRIAKRTGFKLTWEGDEWSAELDLQARS